jgi:Flp pilus assembly pilin Flp
MPLSAYGRGIYVIGCEATSIGQGGFYVTALIRLYARLAHRERGQTMAEYAVVLAVIAIGIFAALGFLSGAISGALGSITRDL